VTPVSRLDPGNEGRYVFQAVDGRSHLFLGRDLGARADCGTRFIVEGQSDYEVLKLCGPPSWTNNRFAFVPVNPGVPYGYGPQQGYLAPVEDWIYDLGSTKLMERLTFSNGRVIRIETLGYGG
jgi:hypothetical protein